MNTRLLFLWFLASSLLAQPFDYDSENFFISKLHYENSSGEKGVTTYLTNARGVLYKAVWEQLNADRYSENFFEYRGNRLERLYRTFSDTLNSTKQFFYDENGLLTRELFKRSDGVEGEAWYTYDDDNKLKELDCKGLNGWFKGILKFSYDEKGYKKTASIFVEDKHAGTVTYEYSNNGNLTTEHWNFPDRFSQTFRYEYIPKDQIIWVNSNPLLQIPAGYRIKKEDYNYNDEVGGPSFFQYDEYGKLIKKTFTRSDSVKTLTSFSYDEKGNLISSHRKFENGKEVKFIYVYNGDGRIIEKRYIHPDGFQGREAFLYDINGRLIAARYDKMDTWLTGNIFFTHDKFDRLINGKFVSDDGFSADIIFTRNDMGLPKKIRWDFSFGKFQEYMFKYTKK